MDPHIRRRIELDLSANGIPATLKNIAAVHTELEKLIKTGLVSGGSYRAITEAISQLAAEHAKATKAVVTGTEAQRKAVTGLASAFGSLDNKIKNTATQLVGFATLGGFVASAKNGVEQVRGMNESLLALQSSLNRSGIGYRQLENDVEKFANRLSMTRQETAKLIQQYQKDFVSFSMKGFENITKGLEKLVGPSASGMQDWLGFLSQLTAKYPDLQNAIENASKGDTKRLKIVAEQLMMSQKISLAEYKRMKEYADMNSRLSGLDGIRNREQRREIEEQQKMFGDFNKHKEMILLEMGKAVMPVFKEISNLIRQNQPQIRSFFQSVGSGVKYLVENLETLKKVAIALFAVWAGGRAMSIGGQFLNIGKNAMAFAGGIGNRLGGFAAMPAAASGAGFFSRTGTALRGGLTPNPAAAMRFGGVAAVAGLASYGLDEAGDYARSQGNERTGAGLNLAGGVAGVGAMALTGASLGALLGPIGAGVGAIVGGIGGLVMNSGSIIDNFQELIGITSQKKAEEAQAKDEGVRKAQEWISGHRDTAKDFDSFVAERSEQIVEQKQASGMIRPENFANASSELERLQKERDAIEQQVQGQLSARPKQKVGGREFAVSNQGYEQATSEMNAADARLAQLQADAAKPNANIGAIQEQIKAIEEYRRQLDEVRRTIGEEVEAHINTNAALREKTAELKAQQQIVENISNAIVGEQLIFEKFAQYAQAMEGGFNALMQQANIIGGVSVPQIVKAYNDVVAARAAELQQAEQLLMLNAQRTRGEALTNEQREKGDLLAQRLGLRNMAELDNASAMAQIQNRTVDIRSELVQKGNELTNIYTTQLQIAQLESNLAATRVQLMDSFATGVGASAQMRSQQMGFIQKEIDGLQKQYEIQKNYFELTGADSSRAKMLEIENQITQKQLQQAEIGKTLRDGWISALGAMNTASGRFTKIMISQTSNLAAGLNSFKVAVSNTSGATRNANGKFGQGVGFNEGSQFSSLTPGQLSSQQSQTGDYRAFDTGRTDTSLQMIEQLLRNQTMMVSRVLGQQAADVVQNGGATGQAMMGQAQGAGMVAPNTNRNGVGSSNNLPTPPTQPSAPIANITNPPADLPAGFRPDAPSSPTNTIVVDSATQSSSAGQPSTNAIQNLYVANLIVQGQLSGMSASTIAMANPAANVSPTAIAVAQLPVKNDTPANNGQTVAVSSLPGEKQLQANANDSNTKFATSSTSAVEMMSDPELAELEKELVKRETMAQDIKQMMPNLIEKQKAYESAVRVRERSQKSNINTLRERNQESYVQQFFRNAFFDGNSGKERRELESGQNVQPYIDKENATNAEYTAVKNEYYKKKKENDRQLSSVRAKLAEQKAAREQKAKEQRDREAQISQDSNKAYDSYVANSRKQYAVEAISTNAKTNAIYLKSKGLSDTGVTNVLKKNNTPQDIKERVLGAIDIDREQAQYERYFSDKKRVESLQANLVNIKTTPEMKAFAQQQLISAQANLQKSSGSGIDLDKAERLGSMTRKERNAEFEQRRQSVLNKSKEMPEKNVVSRDNFVAARDFAVKATDAIKEFGGDVADFFKESNPFKVFSKPGTNTQPNAPANNGSTSQANQPAKPGSGPAPVAQNPVSATQTVTVAGQNPVAPTGASASQVLQVTIPQVVVQVKFENLGQLDNIIARDIENQLSRRRGISNFGQNDGSGRNS